jgi:hypothetical protein
VNEIAAQATDFQRAGECVWLAFLTLFRCLIFEDHNKTTIMFMAEFLLGGAVYLQFYRGLVGKAIPNHNASHLAKELG